MKKHLVEFVTERQNIADLAIDVLESKGYEFDARLSKFAEVPEAYVWVCREVLGSWAFLWTEDQMDDETLAGWRAGHEAAVARRADERAALELEVVRLHAAGVTQRAICARFRLGKKAAHDIIAAASGPTRKEA